MLGQRIVRVLERLNSPIALVVALTVFLVLDGLLLYRYQQSLRSTEGGASNAPVEEGTSSLGVGSTTVRETTLPQRETYHGRRDFLRRGRRERRRCEGSRRGGRCRRRGAHRLGRWADRLRPSGGFGFLRRVQRRGNHHRHGRRRRGRSGRG